MLEASGGAPTVCFWAWTLALLAKRIKAKQQVVTRLIYSDPLRQTNLRWLNHRMLAQPLACTKYRSLGNHTV